MKCRFENSFSQLDEHACYRLWAHRCLAMLRS